MFVRRLVVVEDDGLFRSLLVTQLDSWGFEVAEAANPIEAIAVCKRHDPDGVILDVDLGSVTNGFQLAEALTRLYPHLVVIFLTRFPDARAAISRFSSVQETVSFVAKGSLNNSTELLEVINASLAGRRRQVKRDLPEGKALASLTKKQFEILRLLSEGKTNNQIADAKGITLSAVEKIIGRIFKALNLEMNQSNARANAVRLYTQAYGKQT